MHLWAQHASGQVRLAAVITRNLAAVYRRTALLMLISWRGHMLTKTGATHFRRTLLTTRAVNAWSEATRIVIGRRHRAEVANRMRAEWLTGTAVLSWLEMVDRERARRDAAWRRAMEQSVERARQRSRAMEAVLEWRELAERRWRLVVDTRVWSAVVPAWQRRLQRGALIGWRERMLALRSLVQAMQAAARELQVEVLKGICQYWYRETLSKLYTRDLVATGRRRVQRVLQLAALEMWWDVTMESQSNRSAVASEELRMLRVALEAWMVHWELEVSNMEARSRLLTSRLLTHWAHKAHHLFCRRVLVQRTRARLQRTLTKAVVAFWGDYARQIARRKIRGGILECWVNLRIMRKALAVWWMELADWHDRLALELDIQEDEDRPASSAVGKQAVLVFHKMRTAGYEEPPRTSAEKEEEEEEERGVADAVLSWAGMVLHLLDWATWLQTQVLREWWGYVSGCGEKSTQKRRAERHLAHWRKAHVLREWRQWMRDEVNKEREDMNQGLKDIMIEWQNVAKKRYFLLITEQRILEKHIRIILTNCTATWEEWASFRADRNRVRLRLTEAVEYRRRLCMLEFCMAVWNEEYFSAKEEALQLVDEARALRDIKQKHFSAWKRLFEKRTMPRELLVVRKAFTLWQYSTFLYPTLLQARIASIASARNARMLSLCAQTWQDEARRLKVREARVKQMNGRLLWRTKYQAFMDWSVWVDESCTDEEILQAHLETWRVAVLRSRARQSRAVSRVRRILDLRTQASVLSTWKHYLFSCQRCRVVVSLALTRSGNRRRRVYFSMWRKILERLEIAGALGTGAERHNTAALARLVCTIWLDWLRRKRSHRLILARAAVRSETRRTYLVLSAWLERTRDRKEYGEIVKRSRLRRERRVMSTAFGAFAQNTGENRRLRHVIRTAVLKWMNLTLYKSLGAWRDLANGDIRRRAILNRALQKRLSAETRAVYNAWRERVHHYRSVKGRVRRLALHNAARIETLCYMAWRDWTESVSRLRTHVVRAATSRQRDCLLWLVLHHWKQAVFKACTRKVLLRRKQLQRNAKMVTAGLGAWSKWTDYVLSTRRRWGKAGGRLARRLTIAAFRKWSSWVEGSLEERRVRRCIVAVTRRRFQQRLVLRVLQAWRLFADLWVNLSRRVDNLIHRRRAATLSAVLEGLRSNAQYQVLHRTLSARACAHTILRITGLALRAWKGRVWLMKTRNTILVRAAFKRRTRVLFSSFVNWMSCCSEAIASRAKIRKMLRVVHGNLLRNTLHGWNLWTNQVIGARLQWLQWVAGQIRSALRFWFAFARYTAQLSLKHARCVAQVRKRRCQAALLAWIHISHRWKFLRLTESRIAARVEFLETKQAYTAWRHFLAEVRGHRHVTLVCLSHRATRLTRAAFAWWLEHTLGKQAQRQLFSRLVGRLAQTRRRFGLQWWIQETAYSKRKRSLATKAQDLSKLIASRRIQAAAAFWRNLTVEKAYMRQLVRFQLARREGYFLTTALRALADYRAMKASHRNKAVLIQATVAVHTLSTCLSHWLDQAGMEQELRVEWGVRVRRAVVEHCRETLNAWMHLITLRNQDQRDNQKAAWHRRMMLRRTAWLVWRAVWERQMWRKAMIVAVSAKTALLKLHFCVRSWIGYWRRNCRARFVVATCRHRRHAYLKEISVMTWREILEDHRLRMEVTVEMVRRGMARMCRLVLQWWCEYTKYKVRLTRILRTVVKSRVSTTLIHACAAWRLHTRMAARLQWSAGNLILRQKYRRIMRCCLFWRSYAQRRASLRLRQARFSTLLRRLRARAVLAEWQGLGRDARFRGGRLEALGSRVLHTRLSHVFHAWITWSRLKYSAAIRRQSLLDRASRRRLWRLFAGWVNVVLYYQDGTPRTPSRFHDRFLASLPSTSAPQPLTPLPLPPPPPYSPPTEMMSRAIVVSPPRSPDHPPPHHTQAPHRRYDFLDSDGYSTVGYSSQSQPQISSVYLGTQTGTPLASNDGYGLSGNAMPWPVSSYQVNTVDGLLNSAYERMLNECSMLERQVQQLEHQRREDIDQTWHQRELLNERVLSGGNATDRILQDITADNAELRLELSLREAGITAEEWRRLSRQEDEKTNDRTDEDRRPLTLYERSSQSQNVASDFVRAQEFSFDRFDHTNSYRSFRSHEI